MASPYSLTSASSDYFSSFHLSQSHPLQARVPLPAHSLKSIHGCFISPPSDPVPFYFSGNYKSQDAPLPRGLLGNKEPFLRGGGAVHLLSDARCWKYGPSRVSSDATTGPAFREEPGGLFCARAPPSQPQQVRADCGYTPLSLLASETSRGSGLTLGRAGSPQMLSPRPLLQCPGPKS